MKKNIYLIIIWSISIVAIVAGTLYHTTEWGDKFFGRLGLKSSHKVQTYEETLEPFDKISFDLDLSEIEITEGNDYHISCESSQNLLPKYEVKNGTLVITQTSQKHSFWRNSGNENCTIVLTVPKDATFSSISGDCNLGDVQLSNLTADTLSITCNMGAIACSNLASSSITCECNLGDCEIKDCSFDILEADNDMGNIEVDGSFTLSDYTIDCSVSLGGIEVNGNDYNSFQQKGNTDKTMTLYNNMGSIEIEGR